MCKLHLLGVFQLLQAIVCVCVCASGDSDGLCSLRQGPARTETMLRYSSAEQRYLQAGMVHIPLLEAAGKLLRLQVAQAQQMQAFVGEKFELYRPCFQLDAEVPGEDLSKGLRSLATCCVFCPGILLHARALDFQHFVS